MAKVKKAYFCKNCGFEAPKWLGRCPSCGEWTPFPEDIVARESGSVPANVAGSLPAAKPQRVRDIRESEHRRMDLGNSEVNRVLGGGMVPGSLILLGGEPGIGKSTLSLQLALAANGLKTLYVSGEESAEQIKMRAGRIGIGNDECLIYPETLLENIVAQIAEHRPDLVVIDSIQTIYTDLLDSSAGSVSQIRECAATLLKYAKSTGTSIFIIGHITKDGTIAGPKILEHIVDVVLQFEGDSNNIYRILRGIKNRFGATFEIGVFEMLDNGLRGVDNPSEILLTHYEEPLSGIAVGASADGVRPYLLVSAGALSEKIDALASLPREVWSSTLLLNADADRMRDVLTQIRIGLEQGFINNGHSAALGRAMSYSSPSAVVREQLSGVDFYLFLRDLLEHFDERLDDLRAKLAELAGRIFVADGCLASFTGSNEDFNAYWAAAGDLGLDAGDSADAGRDALVVPTPCDRHEAFVIPSDICFAASASLGARRDRRLGGCRQRALLRLPVERDPRKGRRVRLRIPRGRRASGGVLHLPRPGNRSLD